MKIILRNPLELYETDFPKKSLGSYLFREGAERSWVWPSLLQNQIILGSESEDSLEGPFIFFPTNFTQELFKKMRSKGPPKYLSSQKGVGKTFSVVLFTILTRLLPNCKVFFIHNFEEFYINPGCIFARELLFAFSDILQQDQEEWNKFLEILKSPNIKTSDVKAVLLNAIAYCIRKKN